ncbi:hypothetical protein FA95DRAFT_1612012 [Auriscalpium vulgare]|uniref:Uncharacterized protein n=1 Tax=Auriscalpium vulgare TaxID=40419 RepID=A0ACB8R7R2_9AGAM|nr:hypothetical protein FA95DRAFT_1612012 [Auriscalpium vulgare]
MRAQYSKSALKAWKRAYKRGRLEKSSDGKYRLNVNWDGPQWKFTKRKTRRPLTAPASILRHAPGAIHPPNNTHLALAPGNTPPAKAASRRLATSPARMEGEKHAYARTEQ